MFKAEKHTPITPLTLKLFVAFVPQSISVHVQLQLIFVTSGVVLVSFSICNQNNMQLQGALHKYSSMGQSLVIKIELEPAPF